MRARTNTHAHTLTHMHTARGTHNCTHSIHSRSRAHIRGLVLSADGSSVSTVGDDKSVRVFSVSDGTCKTRCVMLGEC